MKEWFRFFAFVFGHLCSRQCKWPKSRFVCTLLYKQSWHGWYTVLTWEGFDTQIHSPDDLEDEDHSPDRSQWLFPKRFAVLSGDREWGREEKTGTLGKRPCLCGQQTAAKVTNTVVKEKSRVAVSLLVHWAACPGLTSELKWVLNSLFHSFSMPQTVPLFL